MLLARLLVSYFVFVSGLTIRNGCCSFCDTLSRYPAFLLACRVAVLMFCIGVFVRLCLRELSFLHRFFGTSLLRFVSEFSFGELV